MCMLGYTNNQQLHYYCYLMTLGIQVCLPLEYVGMSMFDSIIMHDASVT
jgi:hypothetical protein